MIEKIERLALAIIPGLMLRYKENGYTNEYAICLAFNLAERFYENHIYQEDKVEQEGKDD